MALPTTPPAHSNGTRICKSRSGLSLRLCISSRQAEPVGGNRAGCLFAKRLDAQFHGGYVFVTCKTACSAQRHHGFITGNPSTVIMSLKQRQATPSWYHYIQTHGAVSVRSFRKVSLPNVETPQAAASIQDPASTHMGHREMDSGVAGGISGL